MKSLRVNGVEHVVKASAGRSLLHVLRDDLHLLGTKNGCEMGECGACTVSIGGRPRLACVTLVHRVHGEVTTIEGIAAQSPCLGRRFAEEGGLQCGYCTPGQIMMAYCLGLSYKVGDSAAPCVRREMSGNICRCTGYSGILRAVERHLGEA